MARSLGGHPSKDITGAINKYLAGHCIVLGVTGSVSLYRSLDLARWLMRRGARVRVVMTSAAASLVSPEMFHWATGEEVVTRITGRVEHVELARECDAMVVAPASLSTLAKIAWGVADNSVVLTALAMRGEGKGVLIVPAMHGNMERSPGYREAVSRLSEQGYLVIPPKEEEGVAKYPDVWLVGRITAAYASRGRDLEGARVLVTAGATREWIDDVRFISNPSSGFMGIDLAVEAWARGATVDLVYGHVEHPLPHMVNLYHAETTEDMAERVRLLTSGGGYDIVVAAAAPADYRPSQRFEGKIKSGSRITLNLEPTPKVLDEVAGRARVLVAFAAEAASREDLVESAMEKMRRYNASIVVANRVGRRIDVGFASPRVEAILVWKRGGKVIVEDVGRISKEELSRLILDTALLSSGGPR